MHILKRENSYLYLLMMFYSTKNVFDMLLLAQPLCEREMLLSQRVKCLQAEVSIVQTVTGGVFINVMSRDSASSFYIKVFFLF